ncbi:GTP cyclohydrolase II [alpha proteobacterium HIMB59]|nr:GTP cyclohydrolase II [alpha proteobacterium HIMB59]
MSDDLNRLHIELDYGEIVNFNNLYYTFSTSDENFVKHSKMLLGSLIVLPVLLLKYHGINIKTSEQFLKFPIIKKPKKINDLLSNGKISNYVDIKRNSKLNSAEKKILSIFKKLNILPFPIFLKKKPYKLKFSFNLSKIKSSLNKSKITYKDSTSLPLKKNKNVQIVLFDDLILKNTHYALIFNKNKKSTNPVVRIHSSCLTGDLMGSQKCDCGYQLESAIEFMSNNEGMSILIYLNQEGRGLGIHNKIISYNIQENGWDTYQADNILGFSGDERDYRTAVKILKFFKIKKCKLITNNPEKIEYLNNNKINVEKIIKIKPGVNQFNKKYLITKKLIGKHLLNL